MTKRSDKWHAEGRELQIKGKLDQAVEAYKEALKLEPDKLNTYNNLGIILRKKGLLSESEKILSEGLSIATSKWKSSRDVQSTNDVATHLAQLLNSKSVLALEQNQHQICCSLLLKQIKLEPLGCGYVNLGVALEEIGRHSEAARCHLTSLRRHNIKWTKPEELIGKRLHKPSTSSQVQQELLNLATSRLHKEPQGVKNWYLLLSRLGLEETIWLQDELPWARLWKGQNCKNLLIWDEQGFGDALQCLRWISDCGPRAKNFTIMLRPALLDLVKQRLILPNNCSIYPLTKLGPPLKEYQLHCPLMGLPVALAGGKNKIPYPIAPMGHWLRKKSTDHKNQIGLVWAAGRKETENAQRASERRSMPAKELLKHALTWKEKWDTDLISLQLDIEDPTAKKLTRMGELQQLEKGKDWEATAKVVERLNLVVSVDTAMVHLAGNLGVPCLVLLNHTHDWRWGTEQKPQDWYPKQTVLRCKRNNAWEELLKEADCLVETILKR